MVVSCAQLEKIDFSALEDASSLYFFDLPLLTQVDLHAVSSPWVSISNVPRLATLSLGGLQTSALSIQDLDALTSLEVPNVTQLGALNVTGTPRLDSLSFPNLLSIESSFQIGKSSTPPPPMGPPPPPAPSAISAPMLSSIGSQTTPATIIIEGTNLTTLADFGAKDWAGVVSSDATITSNDLLSDDEITAFRGHLTIAN
jgi:hypothetical protein